MQRIKFLGIISSIITRLPLKVRCIFDINALGCKQQFYLLVLLAGASSTAVVTFKRKIVRDEIEDLSTSQQFVPPSKAKRSQIIIIAQNMRARSKKLSITRAEPLLVIIWFPLRLNYSINVQNDNYYDLWWPHIFVLQSSCPSNNVSGVAPRQPGTAEDKEETPIKIPNSHNKTDFSFNICPCALFKVWTRHNSW